MFDKYGGKLDEYFATLNFEAISKDYDAIHLTSRGESETRFSTPYNLYGWDCESTHWFRWMFDEIKYIGEIYN